MNEQYKPSNKKEEIFQKNLDYYLKIAREENKKPNLTENEKFLNLLAAAFASIEIR